MHIIAPFVNKRSDSIASVVENSAGVSTTCVSIVHNPLTVFK